MVGDWEFDNSGIKISYSSDPEFVSIVVSFNFYGRITSAPRYPLWFIHKTRGVFFFAGEEVYTFTILLKYVYLVEETTPV